MMYLEDYLEMIEHLPQELRDRFTEMRELDLQVQNSMDILEDRVKLFFCNAKRMKPMDKEMEHEAITKEYLKTLEDADEKVQIANQMYDLVARYARRLDQEALKFKLELEADNIGITEILEKRSHDLDSPSTNSSQKENRYDFPSHRNSHHVDGFGIKKRRDSSTNEHKRIILNSNVDRVLPDIRVASTSAPVVPQIPPPSASVSYTLGHIGAGGTAIAAAASQAIVATQQMQQGRRTASLKASYEAIHSGNTGPGNCGNPVGPVSGNQEISISKELAGAAQTAIAAIQDNHKKHKKSVSSFKRKSSMVSSGTPPISSPVSIPSPSEQSVVPATFERSAEGYDPNEPRYCICNEVAFGTMVACDNRTCPYEWYHYPCVGITDKPKGKWYCPHCTAAMKRRSRK